MIHKKTIHSDALDAFGLSGRLKKLRTEATELAHAIDRMEEGKGGFADVLHEYRDCFYVWQSVMESDVFYDVAMKNGWREHEEESEKKLRAAITETVSK